MPESAGKVIRVPRVNAIAKRDTICRDAKVINGSITELREKQNIDLVLKVRENLIENKKTTTKGTRLGKMPSRRKTRTRWYSVEPFVEAGLVMTVGQNTLIKVIVDQREGTGKRPTSAI